MKLLSLPTNVCYSSSSDGGSSFVVQELLIAMRCVNEDMVSRKGQKMQNSEDMLHLHEMLKVSESRCSTLAQQLHEQQKQNQLQADDIHRGSSLLQASESRCNALTKQMQVRFKIVRSKFCFLILQQLLQLHNVQVSGEHASHSASQKESHQRLQVPLPNSSSKLHFCTHDHSAVTIARSIAAEGTEFVHEQTG